MRIMALDVGEKRIGVALSDPLKITAQGLKTYVRTTLTEDVAHLAHLITEYDVSELVVGLPKNIDGSIGFKAEEVQQFTEALLDKIAIDVVYVDERLTTVEAEHTLMESGVRRENRKKYVDKIAAVFILQGYLDARARTSQGVDI